MLGLSQLLLSPCSLWLIDPTCLDALVPEPLLSEQFATNLTRALTLYSDRSAIHPADELNFDIREQYKDSDTQRRDSNGYQRLT